MKTLSQMNIEYLTQQLNDPFTGHDVYYHPLDWIWNPMEMVEGYIKAKFNEDILSTSISHEYVYNSLEQLEYIMPYNAKVITTDHYKMHWRHIDIDITILEEKVIVLSTFEIEKFNSSKIELPFDMDYSEAIEYVCKYIKN